MVNYMWSESMMSINYMLQNSYVLLLIHNISASLKYYGELYVVKINANDVNKLHVTKQLRTVANS